jgi:hypothetical protein
VGWGEGLEDAAAYLNRQPEGENLRVAAWYADGPFSYYFDGQAVPMGYTSPLSWMDIDYAVTYANQWQRQLPSPEAVAYFRSLTPVHTVRAGGLELANVYDMRQVLMPAFIDFNSSAAADWQPGIRLVGHQLEPVNATPGAGLQPGDELLLTLYLQSQAPIDRNYNVLVRLVDGQGNEQWRSEGWPWGAPTAGWPLREVRPDGHTIALPADLPAGLYNLSSPSTTRRRWICCPRPTCAAASPIFPQNCPNELFEIFRNMAILRILNLVCDLNRFNFTIFSKSY